MNNSSVLRVAVIAVGAMTVVAFQNCSQSSFDTVGADVLAAQSSSTRQLGSENSGSVLVSGGTEFYDSSTGNKAVVTRFVQTISKAGGAGLRGCMTLQSRANSTCIKDSEYRVVAGPDEAEGWKYDPLKDMYSVDQDVSTKGFPHEAYVVRLIQANGQRREFQFLPRTVSQFVFADFSSSNGAVITQVKMSVSGVGGAGLRGCMTPVYLSGTACLSDSEYRVIGTSGDIWRYDAAKDLYSVDSDVTEKAWPHTTYLVKYIFPNGKRTDVLFTPTATMAPSTGTGKKGCMWEYNKPVFGPTQGPSASCSQANVGQKKFNDDGLYLFTCNCY